LWRDGGVFFGVPISNFLGWFVTAFLFYAAFAHYLNGKPPCVSSSAPSSFWRSAVAVYAICALGNLLLFAKPMAPPKVVDLSGTSWVTEKILVVDGLTSVLVMGSVALFAWSRIQTISPDQSALKL